MIYLTKGQQLRENPGMVVYGSTGYYNDGDVVICAMAYAPEEPACGYEAKYVAYGTMVYGISDEDELVDEILKIDPESLIGKNKAEVIVDNLVGEIKTVENPTPELTQDAVDINNANVENLETTIDTPTSSSVDTTTTTETTSYDPATDTTTTKTITTTEEIIPEVVEPVIEVPVVETPVIIPDIPVVPEIITPSVDQAVSKLKNIKKIV